MQIYGNIYIALIIFSALFQMLEEDYQNSINIAATNVVDRELIGPISLRGIIGEAPGPEGAHPKIGRFVSKTHISEWVKPLQEDSQRNSVQDPGPDAPRSFI